MSKVATLNRSKPTAKRVLAAQVVRRERLSPSFARVTIAGPALAGLEPRGFDQWFRMFMPKSGGEHHHPLPESVADEPWYAQFLATPDDQRPWMRYVTIRDHRYPQTPQCEIDVDVVVHGAPGSAGAGPLSTWGQTVVAGSPVALLDQGTLFKPGLVGGVDAQARVGAQEAEGESAVAGRTSLTAVERTAPPTADRTALPAAGRTALPAAGLLPAGLVIIGDETAVPGIAGILRSLPEGVEGQAFLEVPDTDDRQTLAAPAGLTVNWYTRQGAGAAPGSLALAAARPLLVKRGGEYVYAAGESKMIAELNGLLREDLQWPKELITTVGYWHHSV